MSFSVALPKFTIIYIESFPQIMEPISAIKRIESNLHTIDQIPTMHLWGNTTAIQALNGNQIDDI